MLKRLCCVSGLLVVLMGLSTFGDEPKKAERPSPVHAELDRLVGSWDVAVEYRYGDKTTKGTAKCEAKWILDGRFVQQEYTSQFMGKPLTIVQLIGYDDVKKKLLEIHLSSNRNQVTMTEGETTDDGKTWTNVGELTNARTGNPSKLRTEYRFKDPGTFTLEWFQPDPAAEGKDMRVVSMTHTRRPKKGTL